MKARIVSILLFLWCYSLTSNAQDTTLPQGKSQIYLISGKIIKDVRLWKIGPANIEYVKDGNLADVKTADVSSIVFSDGTQKIFNRSDESPGVLTGNKKVRWVDTSWTYRSFHIYFGKGGHLPAYETILDKTFARSSLVGTLRDNNGSIYALGGKPQLHFGEDVYLGLEYSLNSQLTIGTWFRPFSSYLMGYYGEYYIAYHSVNQWINGTKYCANASYTLFHTVKPFRIELSGGVSVNYFSGSAETKVSFYDSAGTGSNPLPAGAPLVDQQNRTEHFSGAAVEFYALANFYLGKHFSVFLRPYVAYDQGFSVSAKTFYSHGQVAEIPRQKVNFTGFGMLGGIAIHFGKRKHEKQEPPLNSISYTYRSGPAFKQDTIVRAKAIETPLQSQHPADSIRNISATPKGDSITPQTIEAENQTVNTAKIVTNKIIPAAPHSDKPKPSGLELAGFIFFVLGQIPFFTSLLFWPLGVILSAISLYKIKKYPEKWKGLGLAKAVIIIAGVEIILAIAMILLFLALFPDGFGFGG